MLQNRIVNLGMENFSSLRDRYLDLIDQIVQLTLKGQVRSKEQIYQRLVEGVEIGTGEIFERILDERTAATQHQRDTQPDELKQAKATRTMRALQSIRGEWVRWQEQNQATAELTTAAQTIVQAETGDRLTALIQVLDPNRSNPFNLAQWQQIATLIQKSSATTAETSLNQDAQQELQHLAQGLIQGLEDWKALEDHLVSWIYDQSQGQLGFGGVPGQQGPWSTWMTRLNHPVPKNLFHTLALGQPATDWASQTSDLNLTTIVELLALLRCLQQGLVGWFDKLIYKTKVGAKLSSSTFVGFAVLWTQLANGIDRSTTLNSTTKTRLVAASFQIALQILRTFAQRDYFPLYGGIFASFSGEYLRDALSYLDEPLRQAEGTQEKARILTLLGYSQRALGLPDRAIAFHEQALEIARQAGDQRCEIANLNHLSRTYVAQANFSNAINYSQRALILSRQVGDRLGEANALANLGFSEVFQAQQLEGDPDVYEMAIDYLQQGLQLAERLGDSQSQALCCSSLGIAYVVLEKPRDAIAYLDNGIRLAQFSGDVYLLGTNLAYLAEAHHRLQDYGQAITNACLAMYLLEQIASTGWRQPAGLLTILKGQLGDSEFQAILTQQRSQIIPTIGVDGYDHLSHLLERYRYEG
jgi:tetratricopeptide (TPR) repeat protein/regulator of sigma D